MKRDHLIFQVLFIALLTPFCLTAGELSREPYLQQSSSDSIVVVWRTQGPSTPVLRYGNSPENLSNEIRGDAITFRVSADVQAPSGTPLLYKEPEAERAERESDPDPSTVPNTYQYEAHLSGLQAGTQYFYAVFDQNKKLAGGDDSHYFVTHRPIGSKTDLRIWVVGDSGTGEIDQAMVHTAMQAYVKRTGRGLDHYIHVGDMAYGDGTDEQFQHNFFEPYRETLRNTVCWPSMGNHEGHTSRGISGFGPYYDAYVVPTRGEVGGAPSGTEAYYSYDIEDVHFICLDSHDLDRSPDAAMAQWLRADLDQARAKWLIAFWHHPPYTMGSHNSDRENQLIEMRENLMPILEAGVVDLTLTGHSHIYERSMLIDGAYHTPTTAKGVVLNDGDGRIGGDGAYRKSAGLRPHEGHVSIVAGHGGAGLSREGTMPVMREILLEHGSVLLDIKGDTLTSTMLNKHGRVRDVFSIVKKGRVRSKIVRDPWQPINDPSLLTEIRLRFASAKMGSFPKDWAVPVGEKSGLQAVKVENRMVLKASTGDSPLLALYTPWNIDAFEYGTSMRFPTDSKAGGSLVFGYQDRNNYGRLYLDPHNGTVRVSRVVDGSESVLDERSMHPFLGHWVEFEIEVEDDIIEFQFHDDSNPGPEIEYVLQGHKPFPKGPVGIHLSPNASAEFREFTIENNEKIP